MMSEQESNVCAVCGGMLRIAYTIEFRECMPHSISVNPNQVVVPHMRLCPGHPEPAPKHDGKLGKYHVSYWRETYPLTIDIEGEESNSVDRENLVELSPKEALSLLAWLTQEREELQRLAKEQQGE